MGRVENGSLWSKYYRSRKNVEKVAHTIRRMENKEMQMMSKAVVQQTKDRHAKWSEKTSVQKFIKSLGLDPSRNETLLFHGAPRDNAVDPTTGEVKYTHF